jgi:hypothetical protein
MRRYFLVFGILLSLAGSAAAQTDSSRAMTPAMQAKLKAKKSPMGALLRSVVVPGWGQYYNQKYIKSAIVCGVESFFIVKAVSWWRKTEDQYSKVLATPGTADQWSQFNLYKAYRGNRDDYLWAVGVSVFVSMFDAYVDAHLSGFDIDLTPDFQASINGPAIKLTLRF